MKLNVYVSPGAKRSEVVGMDGEFLRVKVSSPPKEGKANAELVELLSEFFRVPKSCIRILRGERSRKKVIEVERVSKEELERLLKLRKL